MKGSQCPRRIHDSNKTNVVASCGQYYGQAINYSLGSDAWTRDGILGQSELERGVLASAISHHI
jgi:hypothetical protein